MQTFFYIENVLNNSSFNRDIEVWENICNRPTYVGVETYQSKAWRGARDSAIEIIKGVFPDIGEPETDYMLINLATYG